MKSLTKTQIAEFKSITIAAKKLNDRITTLLSETEKKEYNHNNIFIVNSSSRLLNLLEIELRQLIR